MGSPAKPLIVVDEGGALLVCARTQADAVAAEAEVRLGADLVPVLFMRIADEAPGLLVVLLLWRGGRTSEVTLWATAALQAYIGLPVRFNDAAWVLNDVERSEWGVIRLTLRP
jgi:hypothetical protein